MSIIVSKQLDPYWNLAVEACLLDRVDRYAPSLFLWRSRPAVVIGKNQNPWRECNLAAIRRDGAHLARRLSGGGAVYHDEGNLNYAFILHRTDHDKERQFGVVRRALSHVGVDTRIENRNSLMTGAGKISGNAFCFRGKAAMHHGTILVNSDLKRLAKYLEPGHGYMVTHAIASVRSDVVNLRELDSSLTIDRVQNVLQAEYAGQFEGGRIEILRAETEMVSSDIESRRKFYQSDEWIFEHTPAFDWHLADDSNREDLRLEVRVEKGRVRRVAVRGFTGPEENALTSAFLGRPLHALDPAGIPDMVVNGERRRVLKAWLETLACAGAGI